MIKKDRNGLGNAFGNPTPFLPEIPVRKSTRNVHAPLPGTGTKRILVIDETKEMGRLLQGAFSGTGHSVVAAKGGEEDLLRFSEAATFDLLIIGCGSGIDGWAFARLHKERFPSVPILMVACMGGEGVIEKMNEKAVDFLVYKPFRLEDLRQTVEIILLSRPF